MKNVFLSLALISTSLLAQRLEPRIEFSILGITNEFMGNAYAYTTAGTSAYFNCSRNVLVVNAIHPIYLDGSECSSLLRCSKRVNGTFAEKIDVIVDPNNNSLIRAYTPNFCRWDD